MFIQTIKYIRYKTLLLTVIDIIIIIVYERKQIIHNIANIYDNNPHPNSSKKIIV